MTVTAIVFVVLMIASGAVRIGLILLAIWALIRLIDRLRTPIVVHTAAPTEQTEQTTVATPTEA